MLVPNVPLKPSLAITQQNPKTLSLSLSLSLSLKAEMKNPAFPLPLLLLFLVVSQSLLPLSFSNPIHEVLVSNGLPAGLLPKDVKSFSLSESGVLEVFLERPCLTKFDNRVFYEAVVKANLSYGALTNVTGLSQEELFLWLPVKDIIVDDPSSGLIVFDIGVAHKELSLSLFEFPRDCRPGVESEYLLKMGQEEEGFEARDRY